MKKMKKTVKKKSKIEQVGGTHYSKLPIQPWDYVARNGLGYFEGSIVKYVSRWKDKGGLEDLYKARHFLDKLIEVARDDGYSR